MGAYEDDDMNAAFKHIVRQNRFLTTRQQRPSSFLSHTTLKGTGYRSFPPSNKIPGI
jgi:hypothetical protein